ncbi:Holliday junction branch migration protein RuvA [Candidatus Nitrospira nitrificans]|jgi:Holliday junction DNA helicase RuvA|uniref:Holliday junction branch migration complex subunit RuvA n=1 Tax=Candidatus Nitrospira nitrificans TaxID=1742973 RepID=A0A0S4LHZ6_9BACT|nr:Holliday junction branch migration protein RuvA [Candidatus Nitrospira nitrificans]CUS35620.1 Holliday junction ATP-dependent DNA helicase RuvA [Candidatus Nitrospira nitrificans]
MIAFLTGRLAFKAPTHLTLDVQGVGYEVHIPLSTYYALPNLGEVAALNIHTHLREDAIQLFGFLSQSEKESFLLLTSVSGIGPKLALSVLSSLPIIELVHAIQTEDVDKLATVPGIGKKSAGRIALELKDKVGKIQGGSPRLATADTSAVDGPYEDALSALINLGYRPQDAKEALKRVTKTATGSLALKELIREGLKELGRG